MKITRRDLLKKSTIGTSALLALTALQTPLWSKNTIEANGLKLDVLSDGHLQLPASFLFPNMPKEKYEPILKSHNLPVNILKRDCNLTLLRDGKNTILFDVGAGPNFMPTAGKISDAFDQLKVSKEEVTHVVFTHAHPDHLWGVLDEFDEPLFPNAKYLISEKEWSYWTDPNTIVTIEESRKSFAAGANRLLKDIENNLTFFKYGAEVLPNIASIDSNGHTAGHSSFEIKMGSETLIIVGDAIGNHHVSFEQPNMVAGSDEDKEQGVKSRKKLLDKISHEKNKIIGFHLPYPGIGYAEKKGTGYKFIPEK